jgi:hypothetical protein
MVDFNKWRCRNCKHWHYAPSVGIEKCLALIEMVRNDNGITSEECGCINWESNDNLVYLESLTLK